MPRHTYRLADLVPLTGGIRVLNEIKGMPCIQIRSAGEAFTLLASADDLPLPLRRYYEKTGKKLTDTETRLKQNLHSAKCEGQEIARRINSLLAHQKLTEDDLNRLRHVNTRLLDLEKTLQDMIDGIHERMDGFNPSGVEWDTWDASDIILWLEFWPDDERPTYSQDDGVMEPLEIRVRLWGCGERDPCGLDDGENHSDVDECEGHPLQHFHQCYLFHELYDHADVGLWGMLHLRSLWIEIMPHRSGDFTI